jgi:hypothetical protein
VATDLRKENAMDAEDKLKEAIERALRSAGLLDKLYPVEDIVMDELHKVGGYDDEGCFVVYPDQGLRL